MTKQAEAALKRYYVATVDDDWSTDTVYFGVFLPNNVVAAALEGVEDGSFGDKDIAKDLVAIAKATKNLDDAFAREVSRQYGTKSLKAIDRTLKGEYIGSFWVSFSISDLTLEYGDDELIYRIEWAGPRGLPNEIVVDTLQRNDSIVERADARNLRGAVLKLGKEKAFARRFVGVFGDGWFAI